jgi:type I restriction enzyme R subunit
MTDLIELVKALQALNQRPAASAKRNRHFITPWRPAVQARGDDALKMIAKEVAVIPVLTGPSGNRCMIKRVLKRHGYPPGMKEGAVNMVIEQAEGLVA